MPLFKRKPFLLDEEDLPTYESATPDYTKMQAPATCPKMA